jgi:hypothetical protein
MVYDFLFTFSLSFWLLNASSTIRVSPLVGTFLDAAMAQTDPDLPVKC